MTDQIPRTLRQYLVERGIDPDHTLVSPVLARELERVLAETIGRMPPLIEVMDGRVR